MSSNTWTARAVGSEALRAQAAPVAGGGSPAHRLDAAAGGERRGATPARAAAGSEQAAVAGRRRRDLHYLLATPFRYSSPIGSRFRAAADSGIWYGAEAQRTACAELGFWRWRFLMDSAALDAVGLRRKPCFAPASTDALVDLTQAPFKRSRARMDAPERLCPYAEFCRAWRARRTSMPYAMNRSAIPSTARRWPCSSPRASNRASPWSSTPGS